MKLGEIAKSWAAKWMVMRALEITGVAGIEEAQPGELTFLVNRKYRPALETTRASAIFVGEGRGAGAHRGIAFGESVSRLRAGDRDVSPGASFSDGDSSHRGDRTDRENRSGRAHWALLLRGRRCVDRAQRRAAQFRDDLSGRENRRRFFRALACDRARELPASANRVLLQNGVTIGSGRIWFCAAAMMGAGTRCGSPGSP